MIRVTIRAQGAEVAKWTAGRSQAWLGSHVPVAPGLHVLSGDHPVYLDLDDMLGLPTLGEDAYVEFVVGSALIPDAATMSTTTLVAAAVILADVALGGLLARCDGLEVRVENR